MPGKLLTTVNALSHVILAQIYEVSTITIHIFTGSEKLDYGDNKATAMSPLPQMGH